MDVVAHKAPREDINSEACRLLGEKLQILAAILV
jgi:hypothetical protein